jgi:hypothetical protein
MRAFQKLLVPLLFASGSALDIRQLVQKAAEQKRDLQDESAANLMCLIGALSFGASNSTDTMAQDGVLFSTLGLVLGSDLTTICPDPSSCDLAGTPLYEQATGLCTSAAGQLLTTDISICKDTLVTLAESLGSSAAELGLEDVADIQVSNIPVCLPPEPICPANFDLFPALASVLDTLVATLPPEQADSAETKAILNAVSKLLEGEDCSTTSSGSNAFSSLLIAGVLAMGASLFATL